MRDPRVFAVHCATLRLIIIEIVRLYRVSLYLSLLGRSASLLCHQKPRYFIILGYLSGFLAFVEEQEPKSARMGEERGMVVVVMVVA